MFLRDQLEKMPHQPVLYAVRGNNDLASMLPDQLLIELDKHKIWMEHGPSISESDDACLPG